jgi:predicted lipid carrier protein YhbT
VDADTLFFSRRLIMQGSTELGLIVRNAVEAIDFEKMPGGALMQTALRRAVQITAQFA